MSRDDEAGAIAAATYFLTELYPYTVSNQSTDAWRLMSHPECVFCASTLDAVAADRAAGQVMRVAPIRAQVTSTEQVNPLAYGVFLAVETGPDESWTAQGAFIARGEAIAGTASIAVVYQTQRWLVRGVELVRTPETGS